MAACVDAVHARHIHAHQQDIGVQAFQRGQGGLRILVITDDIYVIHPIGGGSHPQSRTSSWSSTIISLMGFTPVLPSECAGKAAQA